jgi:hypothetical protein
MADCMKSFENSDFTPFGYIDCKTWGKAYGMFEPLEKHERFQDTLLLHHMAPDRPDLTLYLGSTPLESESDSGSGSDFDPTIGEDTDRELDFLDHGQRQKLKESTRSETRRRRKERRAKKRRYNMNVRHVSSRL